MEKSKEADTLTEWNLNSPLLNELKILECLSEHDGISTYLAVHESTGKEYIFKNISIPASQTQVDGLRYSGAIQTAGEAQAYYEKVVADFKAELEALNRLAECGSISAYRVFHIQPKEEEVGFDIHLLTDRKQSLAEYMDTVSMTHLKAANLAMDLCNDLADLRQAGYIHCNIKPENIFLNNQGHFMIGDIGLFRVEDLKYAAVPERMLNKFSAPELFDAMQAPNTTVDIYTVGLILYSIYNGNHSPFEDEKTSAKGASEMRLNGTALPAPIYADYEMAAILLKACAFAPEERYQSPEELKEALMDYAQRNEPHDTIIVPPIIADEDTQLTEEAMNEDIEPVQFAAVDELGEDFVRHFSPDTEGLNEIIEAINEELAEESDDESAEGSQEDTEPADSDETASEEEAAESDADEEEVIEEPAEEEEITKQKKKAPFWVWIIVAVLVLAGALTAAYFLLVPNVVAINQEVIHTDSIELSLDANHGAEVFVATATDTYGNTVNAEIVEDKLVFRGLNPGTQYTVKLSMKNGLGVRGTDSVLVTTASATEILYFGAKPVSESQVELYFTIAGHDQDHWKVQYGTSEIDMVESMFSGHSAVISNLKPNSQYTFTLVGTSELSLTGKIQLSYNTTVRVSVEQVLAQSNAEGVTLSWTYEGEAPAEWTVICYGPDGFRQEEIVSEPTIHFADLEKEKVYTMEIFCDGMATAASKTIRTADATISNLSANTEDGKLILSWETEEELADGWMVLCTLADDPNVRQIINSTQTQVSLAGLLPESKYNIEVQTGSGMAVNGESTLEVTTPKAIRFADYGLSSTYIGLFVAPDTEAWTYRNLASPRTAFSGSETIAFAMEAMSGIRSSEDSVDITVTVCGADGSLASLKSYSGVWDEMWDNKLFVGTPKETPQESGSYTLEIFFNGAIAGSTKFSIN